jgi:hypothetical protein
MIVTVQLSLFIPAGVRLKCPLTAVTSEIAITGLNPQRG